MDNHRLNPYEFYFSFDAPGGYSEINIEIERIL